MFLPIEEVVNENDGKEENSGGYDLHQHVPPDMIYYFEESMITILIVPSIGGFNQESRETTVYTHYSSSESTITSHRKERIQDATTNNAFRPVEQRAGDVIVTRPITGQSRVEFHFSIVQPARRPSRFQRPKDDTDVITLPGTFLENSTERFR